MYSEARISPPSPKKKSLSKFLFVSVLPPLPPKVPNQQTSCQQNDPERLDSLSRSQIANAACPPRVTGEIFSNQFPTHRQPNLLLVLHCLGVVLTPRCTHFKTSGCICCFTTLHLISPELGRWICEGNELQAHTFHSFVFVFPKKTSPAPENVNVRK